MRPSTSGLTCCGLSGVSVEAAAAFSHGGLPQGSSLLALAGPHRLLFDLHGVQRGRSPAELCHYTFFCLDYVGVSQYQYGSAVVHFYYAVDEDLHRHLQGVFMPVAVVFSCLSCLGCCYGKYCNHVHPTLLYKVCQLVPSALAFIWDISPIARRLMFPPDSHDPAAVHHLSQVALSLSTTFFFAVPALESCFLGWCDCGTEPSAVPRLYLLLHAVSDTFRSPGLCGTQEPVLPAAPER